MFNALFQNSTIPVLEQVVNFAQARHQVLAGNVANLDTPGYRARDLSPELFQSRLKQAIERRDTLGAQGASAGGSSAGGSDVSQTVLNDVRQAMDGFLYHDDSNDSLEHQVAEISKNQMEHNMALSIMSSQFRLLQSAISERA